MRRLYPEVRPITPGAEWLGAIVFDEWFWLQHELDFGVLTAEVRAIDPMRPTGAAIAALTTTDGSILRRDRWALILTLAAVQTAKLLGSVGYVAFELRRQSAGRQSTIPGRWTWPIAARDVIR